MGLSLFEQKKDREELLQLAGCVFAGIGIGLIVAVAALNIVASLILLVMEKTRDIAILKTMGASARSVMLIFMSQGLLVGAIGTSVGAALDEATAQAGPFLLEIDMRAIGSFKTTFSGPPVNKLDQIPATTKGQ